MARAKTIPHGRRGAGGHIITRRRRRSGRGAKTTQLAFETLSIEGGLLSPDWLARAAKLEAGRQAGLDYRVPRGLALRDEIGRYWRMAKAIWSDLATAHAAHAAKQAALPPTKPPKLPMSQRARRAARISAPPTPDEVYRTELSERYVTALLRDCFGFASIARVETPPEFYSRPFPIGHAALEGRVPLVIAPVGHGLDTKAYRFGDQYRRRSPFGLCQEYLNADDGALWGLVCDGEKLRLLRDNASLTRPAWIEADLVRMFTEGRYADFAALWLMIHETRFGSPEHPVTECSLETWREGGRIEGTRAREQLRHGVEEALGMLGQGFLAHPDNGALRSAIVNGDLSKNGYFQELLRLAYRLIFLLTVEERDVLHPPSNHLSAPRKLYTVGYGLKRLRERAMRRSAHDSHFDQWESLKIVFYGLAGGEPRLALPALGGIFAKDQCPHLDAARLDNRHLLRALFRLSWLREETGLARVNWRDMGPEELGSVYESLLELVPKVTDNGREFAFARGDETKGHARKTTGSYYTPDSLVQVLLDSALEPVIDRTIAEHPSDAAEALLGLSIVDPACGSGHFLLAAARRLATHVARIEFDGTPSNSEYRHALRKVVGRCIYGVDLNPMAVELCKVSLWMEAVEPGLPLTFLDSHIRCGNALLGTSPELMDQGIPDDAWKPIEGDDKKAASALKKRNKAAAEGQGSFTALWSKPEIDEADVLRQAIDALESAPDVDAATLAAKEARWQALLESQAYRHQKLVSDAWCAAFVWPKQPGPLIEAAPTHDLWCQIRDAQGQLPALTVRTVNDLAEEYSFFHWHLAFPHVFQRGGFDVVLGNPPWDKLEPSSKEFFAASRPDIVAAPNAAARNRMIAALEGKDPGLFAAYQRALRAIEGARAFVHAGNTYPLCGVGNVNLYALFAERARAIVAKTGRVGQIVPSGLVTDFSTKLFFQAIMEGGELVAFYDFENREKIFVGIASSIKFGLLTLTGPAHPADHADFVFFATQVPEVRDSDRRITLSAKDIALLNPTTRTCPIFRSRRDAALTYGIYRRCKPLVESAWSVKGLFPIDIGRESGVFKKERTKDHLPLYEGKYFHQFEHRWSLNDRGKVRGLTDAERADPNFFVTPRYWYPEAEAVARFGQDWKHSWVLAWRDITNATNERTFIPSVVPSLALSHSAWVGFFAEEQLELVPCFLANTSALAFDFVARQKTGGTHMNAFIMDQLPVIEPTRYAGRLPWDAQDAAAWLRPRVLELTYTAWDLAPFARDMGYEGPPFRWDAERRFMLRAELDAAFFHLYEIARDDVDYILETFPIVRRNDEKQYGEYRTKRVILEVYDAMRDAARMGVVYATRVDPPAADGSVAHGG